MPVLRKRNPPNIRRVWKELLIDRRTKADERRPSTATVRTILQHGRSFIHGFPVQQINHGKQIIQVSLEPSSYESSLALSFFDKAPIADTKRKRAKPVAELKLGFDHHSVVVQAIQGKQNKSAEIKIVNAALGQPWPNYGLHLIETEAKRHGFRAVVIPDPRENHWYTSPQEFDTYYDGFVEVQDPGRIREIQSHMRQFYALIAKKNKYVRIGKNYVKFL